MLSFLPAKTFDPTASANSSKISLLPIETSDAPPAVPPKSPRMKLKIAPIAEFIGGSLPSDHLDTQRSNTTLQTPAPITAPEGGVSPNPFTSWASPTAHNKPWSATDKSGSPIASSTISQFSHRPTPSTASTAQTTPLSGRNFLSRSNSISNIQRTRSNSTTHIASQHRRDDSESSILDRGRPTKRVDGIIKKNLTAKYPIPDQNFVALPLGLPATAAQNYLPSEEVQTLQTQAQGQAERFEVLKYKDVKDLSRVSMIRATFFTMLIIIRNSAHWTSVVNTSERHTCLSVRDVATFMHA